MLLLLLLLLLILLQLWLLLLIVLTLYPLFCPPPHRAQSCCLVGEFNNWDPKENNWAQRNDFGVFSLFLPDIDGVPQIKQNTKVRLPTFPPSGGLSGFRNCRHLRVPVSK